MGRCLLLADVHANLSALEAVMTDARRRGGFDRVWVVGDIVGYGPQPNECVELLREEALICVAGNHDLGSVGRADVNRFNPDAAAACVWSGRRLSDSSRRFLCALPLTRRESPFMLTHGSPRDPIWEYVTSVEQAVELARFCEEPHCLVGHTHRQSVFGMEAASVSTCCVPQVETQLLSRSRFVINPGSVGQPRDGDARAAYAMYDSTTAEVSFHRVAYDTSGTAELMLSLGLPVVWRGDYTLDTDML